MKFCSIAESNLPDEIHEHSAVENVRNLHEHERRGNRYPLWYHHAE